MNNYLVILYLNHTTGQFSLSARMESDTRLQLMHNDMIEQGFEVFVLSKNLSKKVAEVRKNAMRAIYDGWEYEYVTRQPV